MGNFKDYWDAIYSQPAVAGAAIWDWVDQGIAKPIDGSNLRPSSELSLNDDEFWAYGGDFGDHPNDRNFCLNGIIGPDRMPNPHFHVVRHVYQPIWFSREGNVITLENHDCFTPLDAYDYVYEILKDGVSTTSGSLELCEGHLEMPTYDLSDSGLEMRVYANLRQPTLWADKGFNVASEEFELTPRMRNTLKASAKAPKTTRRKGMVEIQTDNSRFTIDASGALVSWIKNGIEILQAPLEPYFWKPTNDNQSVNQYYTSVMTAWKDQASLRTVGRIKTSCEKSLTKIVVPMSLPIGSECELTYTIASDGQIQVDMDYTPLSDNIPLMPKFGMRMRVPSDLNRVEYLGRGPWENYPDRTEGYFKGRYSMPLQEYQHDYIKPQDNGNRCDVEWIELSPSVGSSTPSLRVEAVDSPLCIRAWDYGEDELEKANHPHELERGKFVNLNIDMSLHGVGGINTWGASTLDPYTIPGTEPHHLSFIISANDN